MSVLATLLAHRDERFDLLRKVSFFSTCSRRELAAIAHRARIVRVPSGTTLTVEGERGTEFFVLAEGLAEVTVEGQRVGSIRAGSCFGEMALLDGGERAATVTTTLPSRLLVLDRHAFDSVIGTSANKKLLRILAERLRTTDGQVARGDTRRTHAPRGGPSRKRGAAAGRSRAKNRA